MPALSIEEPTLTPSQAHEPALLRETIDLLAPRAGATVVDATLAHIRKAAQWRRAADGG